jgi:pyruvate dehydrogenase E1 component alpha subunit
MFEQYDPREGKRLQLLDEQGKLTAAAKKFPLMSDEAILEGYHYLIKTREADEWAVSLQRQGRMPTYAPNKGQEANTVGSLMALRQDDWFVPTFRELGGWLVRGVPLRQIYLYFYGNEEGSRLEIGKYHALPVSIPIASQMLHAVGLAYAERYQKNDRVVISFVGDGGTSEGEFHEALNFAGVWNTGNVFYVQNNQFAISVRRKIQTRSATIAEKAFGYGFEGVQIDGNDLLAVYAATTLAAENGRSGKGPTLIEGYTYRLGAHTTADDPTRYREDSEVTEWLAKDPILRVEKYLLNKKLITDTEIETLKKEAKAFAVSEFEAVEKSQDHSLEDTYRYTFKTMPLILKEQMEKQAAFAKGGAK